MPSISIPSLAAIGSALASVPAELGGLFTTGLTGLGLGSAGTTAGLLGPATTAAVSSGLTDATIGAGLGAVTDPSNPLKGAEAGAITGGVLGGFGGPLGSALGIGATAADTLAGSAGGALGSLATGGDIGTGAITGAASGLAAGLGSPQAPAATAPSAGGIAPAAIGAPAAAAPSGVAPPIDPTASGIANTLGLPTGGNWTGLTGATGQAPGAVPAAAPTPAQSIAQVAGTAPAAAAPAGPTSGERFFNDPSLGSAWNVLKSNPQAALSGLGIGYELMNQGNIPGLSQLKGIASQESSQARALESSLSTGQLPAGYEAALNQAKQAAKAQVRSKYASMGMSGSTPESQDLAQVDVNAVAQSAQIASSLFQAGQSEANLSNELLMQILGINQQQDAATGQALANFAASMGGMRTG